MKVIFRRPINSFLDAARKLVEHNSDSHFTAKAIAECLGMSVDVAFYHIDRHVDIDVLHSYHDVLIGERKGDELYFFIHQSLTEGKTYEVLAISDSYYSILNDPDAERWSNVMSIYHESLFEIVDSQIPSFWKYTINNWTFAKLKI